MMRFGLLVLLLLPISVAAQEAVVDAGSVRACFDKTGVGETMPDCVGDAAAVCSAAHSQPETTLAISQCLVAENGAWDDLLNREYAKTRDAFADQPGLADQLLAAQRAWIAFRDADCAVAYERFGGGSMRTISAGNCQLRHTAQRTFELRDLQGF